MEEEKGIPSALFLRSQSTRSQWPNSAAIRSGVSPSACRALILALYLSRAWAMSRNPFLQATCRGVCPDRSAIASTQIFCFLIALATASFLRLCTARKRALVVAMGCLRFFFFFPFPFPFLFLFSRYLFLIFSVGFIFVWTNNRRPPASAKNYGENIEQVCGKQLCGVSASLLRFI